MISSSALQYFAEVSRCGSFRSAAERLFIAASAISRQVGLLEEDIGAPLFERGRGRKSLRLTAAGELLMRYVQSVEGEAQRVRSDIEALKGMRKGEIRFGMPESFVYNFVPPFLAKFNRLYPAITYSVEVSGSPRLLEMVATDELDVALTFNAPAQVGVKPVFELELATQMLVASDHPLASKESVRLSDMADYGMALPDRSLSAKSSYDEMFAKAKFKARTTLVSNSYELLRAVAMEGMAIAIVNERPSTFRKTASGYRYVPIRDTKVKPQRLAICVRDGRNLPVATLTFIEHLKKEFTLLDTQ
jgi:DNA-binding transcriptional LysR family regulator